MPGNSDLQHMNPDICVACCRPHEEHDEIYLRCLFGPTKLTVAVRPRKRDDNEDIQCTHCLANHLGRAVRPKTCSICGARWTYV